MVGFLKKKINFFKIFLFYFMRFSFLCFCFYFYEILLPFDFSLNFI